MKTQVNPCDVRVVEWIDSCTAFGWQYPDSDGCNVIRSIGMLVRENEREVTLSTSKSTTGRYLDQVSIPRTSIRFMKKIKI